MYFKPALLKNDLLIYGTGAAQMQMDFRNSAQTLEGSKCGREGNKEDRDFPGGLVIKNPPRNATDAGTVPGQGTKILCALQWVSPQTSTTEPSLWSLHAATRMPVESQLLSLSACQE